MVTAKQFVQKALSYEGSKDGDYFIRLYNQYTGRGIPYGSFWCAMFVTVIARLCGVPTSDIPNYEGCITGKRLFQSLGRWKPRNGYTPKAGDIVIFDWDPANGNGEDHTGIVVSVSGGRVYTIEGNAGNNGVCMRRDYALTNGTIVGYGTPIFETEEDMTKAEAQALIDAAVKPVKEQLTKANAELATLKKTYAFIEDVPEWYREAVQYYMDKGVIKGKEIRDGKPFLDLTATECRMVTMMYRAETGKDAE